MRPVTATVQLGAVLLAALLLAGCATATSAPPSGVSQQEQDRVRAAQLDAAWAGLNLPEEQRPTIAEYTIVNLEDWARHVAGCMSAAGYDNYDAIGGTLQASKPHRLSESVTEDLDLYTCRASYQRNLTQVDQLNTAQRNYLYDYYQQSLVPCLALAGVQVTNAPTREQFAATGTGIGWNPYLSMDEITFGRVIDRVDLLDTCPSFPQDSLFDAWRVRPGAAPPGGRMTE